MLFDAYIPVANCQSRLEEVLNSIHTNPLISNVWEHPTRAYSTENYDRMRNIAHNKAEIFRHALKTGDEFFLLINSDRVLHGHEIELMYDFLINNPEYGAVGYSPRVTKKQKDTRHIASGLLLIRTEAVKEVKINMPENYNRCDCLPICQEIRASGWKMGYVGDTLSKLPKESIKDPVFLR